MDEPFEIASRAIIRTMISGKFPDTTAGRAKADKYVDEHWRPILDKVAINLRRFLLQQQNRRELQIVSRSNISLTCFVRTSQQNSPLILLKYDSYAVWCADKAAVDVLTKSIIFVNSVGEATFFDIDPFDRWWTNCPDGGYWACFRNYSDAQDYVNRMTCLLL